MKLETTPRENHQVEVIAELEPEVLERFMRRAARKISEGARIPGFRPGKAPYDVIRRMYGDAALQQEAIELIIDDIYPQILDEAKIEPGAPGSLEEIISIDPPKLKFLIPLEATVELMDYRSIHHDYTPDPVTDEEVEDFLRNLQRRSATAEPVERPAQAGDMVYMKISGEFTEPEEGKDAQIVDEMPYQIIIGEDTSSETAWPFVGFSQNLIGMSANETRDVEYTFEETSKFETLRGKKAIFHITVQSIKSMSLPELNDEFAKGMGNFDDLDALRNAVRMQIESHKMGEYDEEYIGSYIDEIVEGSTVLYPPQMVEHQIEHMLEDLENDLRNRNMDLETYLKTMGKDRDTFIAEDVRPNAEKRLKRSLVLTELTKQEKIEVNQDELSRAVINRLMEMDGQRLFGDKKPTNKQMQEVTEYLTYDSANRLLGEHLYSRLKSIASGIPEPEPEPVSETEMVVSEGALAVSQSGPAEDAAASEEETSEGGQVETPSDEE